MTTPDAARREREYSPSSAIGGDYAPFLARYRAESEAARSTVSAQLDVRYGPAARGLLDWFPAPQRRRNTAQSGAPGLLVYFHGGYWQELSKDDSAFLAPAWHEEGIAHAVIGYTLAPQATLAQIVSECRAAVAWLCDRGDELWFDPANVVIAGSSAGAYLAAACATGTTGWAPRGVALVSGIYDVAPLVGTSINDALGLDAAAASALDLFASRPRSAAVVAWGEIETSEFKRQGAEYAAHVEGAGFVAEVVEASGRNHFDVVLDLADPTSPLFRSTRRRFAHPN